MHLHAQCFVRFIYTPKKKQENIIKVIKGVINESVHHSVIAIRSILSSLVHLCILNILGKYTVSYMYMHYLFIRIKFRHARYLYCTCIIARGSGL